MRKLVCDGCGRGELLATPEKTRQIRPVTFCIVNDSRETVPTGTDKFEADLCPDCTGHLLTKYFRMKFEGTLELPSFLEPTEQERERRITAGLLSS